MTPGSPGQTAHDRRRRISWPALVGVLACFALLPAFVSVIAVHGDEVGDTFPDASSVVRALVVDQAVAALIAVVVVARLGWWGPVLREPRRARGWVWIVPATLAAASLAFVDYSRLQQAGGALIGALLVATLLIGVAEELMFRGVLLTAMRDRYGEVAAAAVTAVVFGALHVVESPLNAVASAVAGYLFYASRRVSGGIVVPILVHAVWDFSLFSGWTTAKRAESPSGPLVLFLVSAGLLVLLVVRRRAVDETAPVPAPVS